MTKQARAATVNTAAEADPLVVQLITRELSPADAGRDAGIKVFDGFGAEIMAFIKERFDDQEKVLERA